MKIKRDPLDILFSEVIRRRAVVRHNGCERCLKPMAWQRLQCSHFWGRAKRSVRYDEDNANGFCFGCHQYLGSHPAEYASWKLQELGQKAYDLLDVRAHQVRGQKLDTKIISLYLKEKLKELNGIK